MLSDMTCKLRDDRYLKYPQKAQVGDIPVLPITPFRYKNKTCFVIKKQSR